jgi:hypothetical protein
MNEIWKPLVINNECTQYTISSHGNIRDENGLLTCNFGTFEGHYTFDFKKNGKICRIKIHRYVAMNFLENPYNFKYICHIDGDTFDNRVSNLKWVSSSQNKVVDIDMSDKIVPSTIVVPKQKCAIEVFVPKSIDEIWKIVVIDKVVWNYEVSNIGNIRITSTQKLRSLNNNTGYITCSLFYNGKPYTKQVHRLVAQAFLPPYDDPDKTVVNHKDYNKTNNHVDNLEWVSISENNKHAHQNTNRKITKIAIIRRDLDGSNPVTYKAVNYARKEFGSQISTCLSGKAKQAYGYLWEYVVPPSRLQPRQNDEEDFTESVQIENHPDFVLYKDGRVYNKKRKQFLTPRKTGSYMSVVLNNKHYCIHRLLGIYFVEKPENFTEKWIVNHKDGDKTNNRVENLEWMSASANTQHAYNTGLHPNIRAIVQKDVNGNIIAEYSNAVQVSKAIGRDVSSIILQKCKHPTNSIYGGFKWEFKE